MHIEPGVVTGAKLLLGHATAAASLATAWWLAARAVKKDGVAALALRTLVASFLVFCFFEVFPHRPVGVSEVHLILGSTLLLLFGPAAAALGLAGGLLAQGMFFAPADLPQFGMNVTTLLVPLFATALLARRIVAPHIPYVELRYRDVLRLSLAYQGGVVSWVAFWALYGQGLGADNLTQVASFGVAYLSVVLVEPLIDLAVLAAAKAWHRGRESLLLQRRLFMGRA
jgi:ABC-type Co2+ transport system permease subunit